MAARYATAIAFILCATAFPAFAGPTYYMVGGICTDGTRDAFGELLCSHSISVTVEMREGYVPGTFFFEDEFSDPQTVAFFTFEDGSPLGFVATSFPPGCCGGNIGRMGGASEGDFLQFHWLFGGDGPYFDADTYSGTWFFATPKSLDPGDVYFSSGTYDYWLGPRVVAEPQSLALAGVALATLVLVRSRRSRVRMCA
jgi:hypothetical protein